MKNVLNFRKLMMSAYDCGRLQETLRCAKEEKNASPQILNALEKEIGKAMVFPPDKIPPYLVTSLVLTSPFWPV